MLYNSDKTVKCSSKLGVERFYFYQNDCCQSKNIKLRLCISACVLILISVVILTTVYYFSVESYTFHSINNVTLEDLPFLNPTDLENSDSSEQNETEEIIIENLNMSSGEMPTPLPFLSSWLSSLIDPEPEYESRVVRHRSEKIPRPFLHEIQEHRPSSYYGHSGINRNTYQQNGYPKINSAHDILHYLEDPQAYDKTTESDYTGVKFRGTFHHPLLDSYPSGGSNTGRKVNSYSKIPIHLMDPFYRYKPQNPGEINLLAPNNYRFSLPSFQKNGLRSRYPLYEGEADPLHPRNHMKPLSVMLDIYPMTNNKNQEMDTASTIHAITKPTIQAVLPLTDQLFNIKTQNIIETQQETNSVPYPYYKSSTVQNEDNNHNQNEHTTKEPQSPNKMVVHLNLYPRKRHRSSQLSTKTRNKAPLTQHKHNNLMTEAYYKKNTDYGDSQSDNYNTQEYDYPVMEISPRYNKRKHIQNRKYITQQFSDEALNAFVAESTGSKNNSEESSYPPDSHIQEMLNQTEEPVNESFEENKIHLQLNNSFLNVFLNRKPSNPVLHPENKTSTYFQNMLKNKNMNVPDYTFSTPPQVTHSKYATPLPPQFMHWDLNKLQIDPSLMEPMEDIVEQSTEREEI